MGERPNPLNKAFFKEEASLKHQEAAIATPAHYHEEAHLLR